VVQAADNALWSLGGHSVLDIAQVLCNQLRLLRNVFPELEDEQKLNAHPVVVVMTTRMSVLVGNATSEGKGYSDALLRCREMAGILPALKITSGKSP
jgi:hypothetical protein